MLEDITTMVVITLGLAAVTFFTMIIAGADCLGSNCQSPANRAAYLVLGLVCLSVVWTLGLIVRKFFKR